jgi:hypothetical protein
MRIDGDPLGLRPPGQLLAGSHAASQFRCVGCLPFPSGGGGSLGDTEGRFLPL